MERWAHTWAGVNSSGGGQGCAISYFKPALHFPSEPTGHFRNLPSTTTYYRARAPCIAGQELEISLYTLPASACAHFALTFSPCFRPACRWLAWHIKACGGLPTPWLPSGA